MKLASFEVAGTARWGVVLDQYVLDVNRRRATELARRGATGARERADREIPPDLVAYLRRHAGDLGPIRELVDGATDPGEGPDGGYYPLREVRLLAPVPRPGKIVCIGLNFEDYRKLLGLEYLPVPQLFLKAPSAVIGPDAPIQIPSGYGTIYHEWELACVIRRRTRGLEVERYAEAVLGYTILNDITAHDIELKTREFQQWAKNMDTFAPMGPWVLTADEVGDPQALAMRRLRNGRVEAESTTRNMRYSFAEILAFVTAFMTLEPGDVVTSASPPAAAIQPGDRIGVEVAGLGTLSNIVASVAAPQEYARRVGLS